MQKYSVTEIHNHLSTLIHQMPEMKATISELLGLETQDIGITATTGEGLTDFGRGGGIQVLCIVTAVTDV